MSHHDKNLDKLIEYINEYGVIRLMKDRRVNIYEFDINPEIRCLWTAMHVAYSGYESCEQDLRALIESLR